MGSFYHCFLCCCYLSWLATSTLIWFGQKSRFYILFKGVARRITRRSRLRQSRLWKPFHKEKPHLNKMVAKGCPVLVVFVTLHSPFWRSLLLGSTMHILVRWRSAKRRSVVMPNRLTSNFQEVTSTKLVLMDSLAGSCPALSTFCLRSCSCAVVHLVEVYGLRSWQPCWWSFHGIYYEGETSLSRHLQKKSLWPRITSNQQLIGSTKSEDSIEKTHSHYGK